MKRIFSLLIVLSLFVFFALPAAAKVDWVKGGWDVSGTYVFDYHYNGGVNLHDMTLIQAEDGSLTGSGGAFAGALPYQYPWTIVSGSVEGDTINLTADYDNLACFFSLTGTINPDGTMSGTWTDDCAGARNGTWATTVGEATRFEGNHGQYVRSQEDKQEAAQSRVGMPEQSKGHVVEEE